LGVIMDPNVHIQESKVATCDIQPGRRPRGKQLLDYVAEYRVRAGLPAADGAIAGASAEDGYTNDSHGPVKVAVPPDGGNGTVDLRAGERKGENS
ncbi:MAG: hypothetical protein ACTHK1_15145, partial [Actinomycetales bacterium]